MSLSENFIIPVKNKEEWNKILLILSYYGFITNNKYEELLYDFPYIRYDKNYSKIITSGSSLKNFKNYSKNHKLLSVNYIIETF